MSTKKSIIPLGDRVLILRKEEAEKTASGIIIPETIDKERPQIGEVVAVGEGRMNDEGKVLPLKVKKGDTVLFSKFSPDEVEIEGQEYLIVNESNILAIVK